MFFYILIIVVILQRLIELNIASRNTKWIKEKGGYEVGEKHYKYIVFLHTAFFLSLFVEILYFEKTMAVWWWFPFLLFILAQAGRIWSLATLGPFWNTRIMILPGAKVVSKGPYRFFRHPNYMIVTTEILVLPIMFQAYLTAIVFTFLNIIILSVRITQEENALKTVTNYEEVFKNRPRLFPTYEE